MSAAHQLAELARQRFRERFGHPPNAVAVAPGRINIIGEHTDYNEGWVLPAAIDRYIAVATRPRHDREVVLWSDRHGAPVRLPELPAARRGDWTDYVVGVASELPGAPDGFDLAVLGDIPTGAGLSSSAALEVATGMALLASAGDELPGVELARLCQRAENHFVGARTGIMDQFTAIFASAGKALLLDCRSLQMEGVPLPGASHAWLLADTRVKHKLAGSGYNQRRAECEAAAAALGVIALRDASEADLERIEDPLLQRRARHVLSENARVKTAAAALRRRDAPALGPLLYASHESLKDDFSVSCPELDCLVELASESPAILGARMMGAGFGGCVLILADAGKLDDVEDHLRQGYAGRFNRPPDFYRVRSVDHATVF